MVIRDVATRWNSTHAMIKRGRLLSEAIDEWTFRNKDFRAISLRENDWIQLEQIERVLEVSFFPKQNF
ncbi:hypothetical protein C8R42DRAFT_578344 [Lentinula raphanica]|nr:hypothetical protein C8R42DRAFT_578254 [Lentinula raphanica]KAJ3723887.1 hypothetical protein C8R42DRAFT_578344 [Lentinula raphanica]